VQAGERLLKVPSVEGFKAGDGVKIGVGTAQVEDNIIEGFGRRLGEGLEIDESHETDEERRLTDDPALVLVNPLAHDHAIGVDIEEEDANTINDNPSPAPGPTTNCHITVPTGCVIPFTYKGLSYHTCTGVDAVDTLWCSTAATYSGGWKRCHNPCKNQWPAKKIASTVIAGSVAATGLGLMTAAVVNNHQTGHFDPFYHFGLRPVGNEHITPAPTLAPPPTTSIMTIITPAQRNTDGTIKSGAVAQSVAVIPKSVAVAQGITGTSATAPPGIRVAGRRLDNWTSGKESGPHPTPSMVPYFQ
jgi:hypothetical protein